MIARALGALLVALSLVGGGYWWGDSARGDHDAAQALTAARNKAATLAVQRTSVEHADEKSSYEIFATSSAYQKGLSDGAATQKDIVARHRSGDLSLSIPTRQAAAGSVGPEGAAAAGLGRCDGPARAELSDEAAEFLTGLASEADGVVRQLGACQADVRTLERQFRELRSQCRGEPASE